MLRGNLIKMSFAGNRDHPVSSRLRTGGLAALWPRGRRISFAAARLLKLWVLIPPDAWMSICCECFVMSGTGLCDENINLPKDSY